MGNESREPLQHVDSSKLNVSVINGNGEDIVEPPRSYTRGLAISDGYSPICLNSYNFNYAGFLGSVSIQSVAGAGAGVPSCRVALRLLRTTEGTT